MLSDVKESSWRLTGGARAVIHPARTFLILPRDPFYIDISHHCREDLILIATDRYRGKDLDQGLRPLVDSGWISWTDSAIDEEHQRLVRCASERFAWMLPAGSEDLHELAIEMHARRNLLDWRCFQGPCLPETTVRRALVTAALHPGGAILLLGDDDLVAPVLARIGCRPYVIDIDQSLLDTERIIADRYGLSVSTRLWDIADPVPPDMSGAFDAVLVDPMAHWFDVVLSRAVSMLRLSGSILLAVYGGTAREARNALQRMALEEVDCYTRFSHYFGNAYEDLSAYDSDLFVLRSSPNTRPVVDANQHWRGEFEPTEPFRYEYTLDAADCEPVHGWDSAVALLRKQLDEAFGEVLDWASRSAGDVMVDLFSSARVLGRLVSLPAEQRVMIDFLAWGDVFLIDIEIFCRTQLLAKRVVVSDHLRKI